MRYRIPFAINQLRKGNLIFHNQTEKEVSELILSEDFALIHFKEHPSVLLQSTEKRLMNIPLLPFEMSRDEEFIRSLKSPCKVELIIHKEQLDRMPYTFITDSCGRNIVKEHK